jgi:hypothetical protein
LKKIYLLGLFLCIGISELYSQGWAWRQGTQGSQILKDQTNNLYVFSNGNPNFTIEKIDINGTVLWTQTATGNASISAYKIDLDNNLVVLGNLTSSTTFNTTTITPKGNKSFFILKLSPSATVLSANVYGSPNITTANDLFINSNGDYLIGGSFIGTFSINGYSISGDTIRNLFIIKMDKTQNVIWFEKSTNRTSMDVAQVDELVETTSGKIYATITFLYGLGSYKGYNYSNYGQFLIQLDISRNITWSNYLNYPSQGYEQFSDIQTNFDDVYMKNTYTGGHSGSASSVTIFHWDIAGTRKGIGFGDVNDMGYNISNGKIYYGFVGETRNYSNVFYRKIGTLSLALSTQGQTFDSTATPYGNYSNLIYLVGSSVFIGGNGDGYGGFFAGKYNSSVVTSSQEIMHEGNNLITYPNPANGMVTIKSTLNGIYLLKDELGKTVQTINLNAENQFTQTIENLHIGTYFILSPNKSEFINQKIIVLK